MLRATTIFLAALVPLCALALAGCGEPEGKRVQFGNAIAKGDGFRMVTTQTMSVAGAPSTAGMARGMSSRMVTTWRCTDVAADGSRTLEFAVEEHTLDGAPAPGAEGAPLRGTLRTDAEGRVASSVLHGGDFQTRAALKKLFGAGALPGTVALPKDGVRVGQSVAIRDVVSEDDMAKMMGAMNGVDADVDLGGTYTLVGLKQVDGVEAGEFLTQGTIRARMKEGAVPGMGAMDMEAKMTGTSFMAVATGLPVGTATLKTETIMKGGPTPGTPMNMTVDATMTFTRLAK